MKVMCFGGDLHRKVIEIDDELRDFGHIVYPSEWSRWDAREEREERYHVYRGYHNSSGEGWFFAVLQGQQPTDEMAAYSQPCAIAEREELERRQRVERDRAERRAKAQAFIDAIEGANRQSREF